MHSIGRVFPVAITVLAVIALAGCGARSDLATAGPSGTPAAGPRWTSCDDAMPRTTQPPVDGGTDPLVRPRLGDDFAAVAAIVCGYAVDQRPDGGQDEVATESRADDVTALVAALRLPDQPRMDDPCRADLPTVPWIALLDGSPRAAVPPSARGRSRPAPRSGSVSTRCRPSSKAPASRPASSSMGRS